MIQEARDTLVNLKSQLERIHVKKMDVMTGWRSLRNNANVNGIEQTLEIEAARIAFLDAAETFTGSGDVMAALLRSPEQMERDFDFAMRELRNYRTALRMAKGREDARIICSVNETEVPDPF